MNYFWQNKVGIRKIIKLVTVIGCICSPLMGIAEPVETLTKGLRIETGALGEKKYTLNVSESKPLMQDSELNPDFIKLLKPYPQALEAAQNSVSYSGVSTMGSVIMAVGAIMALSDTLDDQDKLNNNQLPDSDNNQSGALAVVVVGAAMLFAGGSMSKNAMEQALNIFNKKYNKNKTSNNLDQRSSQSYLLLSFSRPGCNQYKIFLSACMSYNF